MAIDNSSNEKPKKSRTAAGSKSVGTAGSKSAGAAGKKSAGAAGSTARAPRSASSRASSTGTGKKKAAGHGTRPAGAPTYEQIAVRAYEIWERQGKPEGLQMENWLQAEKELREEGPA